MITWLVPLYAASASAIGNVREIEIERRACASTSTLGALSCKHGKYFGTAMSSFYMGNSDFSQVVNEQFNQITPDNEMKFLSIHPQRNTYNWTGADLVAAQAKQQGAKFRGHNLCWGIWNNPTDLKQVLHDHVTAVMSRYASSMYAMDVVNEPIDWNGNWEPSVWYKALGADYVSLALQYAHAAAPNVKLYINEFDIETVNAKSKALLAIAKNLLAKGVPLHGIGFQCHLVGGAVPADLAASMKMFSDIGLDVAITELDIRLKVNSAGTASSADLAQQAKDYATVTTICRQNAKCPGVTVWSFDDGHSWVPESLPGYGAACLADRSYNAKPAYYSTINALQ